MLSAAILCSLEIGKQHKKIFSKKKNPSDAIKFSIFTSNYIESDGIANIWPVENWSQLINWHEVYF